MKIAICDDNKIELSYIYKVISKAFKNHNVICDFKLYNSANKLLAENFDLHFDVIFLDLDMPEISGMEVASRLNKLNENTEIVFVTNHDEFVYKAYKFKALGFIRKKYLDNEIDEILDSIIESINLKHQFIVFPNSKIKYNINEIIFMQSDDHYIDIITTSAKDTIRDSLNNIEKTYAHYGFIRIHSRYLVSYRYIYSIENSTVILINQQQLPMSRNKVSAVKEMFQFFSRRI